MCDLYAENYETLMKEIKEGQINGEMYSISWWEDLV